MKELQRKVLSFVQKTNTESGIETNFIDLTSEVGELGKEILKSTNYGKSEFKDSVALRLETGDVLYSLIKLSNELQIDLEEVLDEVLVKYQSRFDLKKEISSK